MNKAIFILLSYSSLIYRGCCGRLEVQLFIYRIGGGSQVQAIDISPDATVGKLMAAIELPSTSALSFHGEQLDETLTLGDAGIGSESVLREVMIELNEFWDRRPDQNIIFHSPRHITLAPKDTVMKFECFDRNGGCGCCATVAGSSARREGIKFKVVKWSACSTNCHALLGIQKAHSADQSQWDAFECEKAGFYGYDFESVESDADQEWKEGDEVEIAVQCDDERVTHLTMSKNGGPATLTLSMDEEEMDIERDDWEFVVMISSDRPVMFGEKFFPCNPIEIEIID